MTATDPSDFFDLAARKLDWLNDRAGVLAGNVANADTPGYKPRDLAPFSSFVTNAPLSLATTDPSDFEGAAFDAEPETSEPAETAPDGNSVSIDQQMRLIASNDQEQGVVTTLYKKYLGLTQTALGVSG